MKTMYLIGGTMGVDKTTISRQLKKGQGVKDKGWKTRGERQGVKNCSTFYWTMNSLLLKLVKGKQPLIEKVNATKSLWFLKSVSGKLFSIDLGK